MEAYEIWIADLNPRVGTEPGKTRPVLVVQTNLLNKVPHSSTLVCPITTKINRKAKILRVHVPEGIAGSRQNCDIMIDQLRAIDNRRLIHKIGRLPTELKDRVRANIKTVLDLDE